MAAPAFSAAGAGVGTETSGAALTPACPATVNAGDLLICQTHWEGGSTAPSTPAGWTAASTNPVTVGATAFRAYVFGLIAAGTEGGTTINLGAPANANMRHAIVYRFTGVRNDVIANVWGGFASTSDNNTTATVTDAGVTTPEADCLAVNLIFVNDDNPLVAFTGMTGGTWTEPVAEYTNAATTPDVALGINVATMASAGTIDGGTQTMAAIDPWAVIGFYIRGTAAAAPEVIPNLHMAPYRGAY